MFHLPVPRSRRPAGDDPSEVDEIEALAAVAAAGDPERGAAALGLLYEILNAALVRDIRRRVQTLSIAEDLAQDVWVNVARSIPTYQGRGGGFVSWLFSIGRNRVVDHYKASARRVQETLTADMLAVNMASSSESPEEAAERREFARLLAECVNRLSKDQREAVSLRMFAGLTLAQTASSMGKSVGAVKVLQHRALQRLGRIMPESGSRLAEYILTSEQTVRDSAPAGATARG